MGVQGIPSGRLSKFGLADLYSIQSFRGLTPRPSNFKENCCNNRLYYAIDRIIAAIKANSFIALNWQLLNN